MLPFREKSSGVLRKKANYAYFGNLIVEEYKIT